MPDELNDGKQVQENERVMGAGGGGCRTIVVDPCSRARALLSFSASARNWFHWFIVLVGMDMDRHSTYK